MLRFDTVICLVGSLAVAAAQQAPTPPPPAPTNMLPVLHVIPPQSPNVRQKPASRTVTPPARRPNIPPTYRPMPDGLLAWDAETQETNIKFGTPSATLAFNVTNVSDKPVIITSVRTSCGCTTPKMPPLPWTLGSGTNGHIDVTMNLAGKRGTVIKTVTVTTDQGFKTLYVKTHIEEPPAGVMGEADRMRNLQIATANRQAVFQGQCASCHVTPALNKMGADLYNTACGICHEAEHRASMVPDLKNLQKETDADYWHTWITSSTEGKLMPAFAIENGGFLNAMQINSLVKYLTEDFPPTPSTVAAPAAAPAGAPGAH